ncbi:aspartyl protease family protein [Solitalea koreensis]|uniref:Aspartyl protease n=1 Tax=Solitalea koreensis TaxID=543615 RepID=A0A521AVE2_9SPHI|nr:aspartyl protease family protein [Solitalea koreensis]SMO38822.1 Aspartyl protease [Solitalea koreensis]
MKRTIVIIAFLIGFALPGFAQNASSLMKVIEQAFKERKAELLKPQLASNFALGVYSLPRANVAMDRILTHYAALDKLELLKEKKNKTGKILFVKFSFVHEKSSESVIYLDQQGKIERFGFFDQLFGIDINRPSKLMAEIPFVIEHKSIVLKVKLNNSDRELRIMFDTGADGMGMKKAVADEIGLKVTRQQNTNVVGASTQVSISGGNLIKIDTLKIANQNIAIFPTFRNDLDGLLGGNLLANYITYLDFDHSVIKLYSFGTFTYPEGGTLVPLDYSAGIPGIKAGIKLNSGKEIESDLHFDTGAAYPIILYGPSVNRLELTKDFNVAYEGVNYSMGHQTPTVSGLFEHVKLGDKQVSNFIGTIQSYSESSGNWAPGDGSLGLEIIRQFNCFINLAAHEYYLIPNKNMGNL